MPRRSAFAILAVFAVVAVVVALALPGTARADVAVDVAHLELQAGTSAALPQLRLVERKSGDIGEGTVVLRASQGFAFGVEAPVRVSATPAVDASCNDHTMLLLGRQPARTTVEVWPTAEEIAVEVTQRSRGGCQVTLAWSGIVIDAVTPGEGAVTLAGTSMIVGAPKGTVVATLVATAPAGDRAFTWGSNVYGELAVGYSGPSSATPHAVSGLAGVTAVAAGDYNTFAVLSDGTVWGWGRNASGQLGDGTTDDRESPVQAQGVTGAADVAAGDAHTLALLADQTLWAWGGNWVGQLGDGTTDPSGPKPVPGLAGVVAVAAGRTHSLALTKDGTLYAWGENQYGQLGDGTTTSRSTPTPVMSGVRAVAAGDYHTVVLKTDGTVWAWGGNGYGQLGIGVQSPAQPLPQQVSGLVNVVSIGAGDAGSFAVTNDGSAWAWGHNQFGQLGIGTASEAQTTPAQVASLAGVAQVDGGEWHTLFRLVDGSVFAAGSNYYGNLGEGWSRFPADTYAVTPIQSDVLSATDIAATELHSAAVAP
jgi:alpha-tubulin suppressor-like RCC1 family protein